MRQTDVMKLPDGRHLVENGLYLEVRKNGTARGWILRIQSNGTRKTLGLGSAKVLSLAAAQKKAVEIRAKLANGEDIEKPVVESKTKSHKFKDVAVEAIAHRQRLKKWKNEKHAQQWANTIRDYANPVIGSKDVAEITKGDILEILDPIWETKSETATRLCKRLEIVFDYAIRNEWRSAANPARWKGLLEFDLPGRGLVIKRKHHSAPSLSTLQEVAVAFWNSGTPGHLATLFGILTASRCCEFCPAEWVEVDLKKKVWSVPPARRKDKKDYPHRVPLSGWAIKILERLRGESESVFPGKSGKHISEQTPRILLIKATGQSVTMHGCRSTFRDWCAENQKDPILAEKSLMHATGGAVQQAYQRSDLLEQRRPLMEEWAKVVMANVRGS